MKTKKNQSASFEEIVFENRNKAYGAFFLRSSYSRTVMVSATITLFVFSALVSWAVWANKSSINKVPPDRIIIIDSAIVISPDQNPPDLPKEKELPRTAPPLLNPVVVDSIVDNNLVTQGELEGIGNSPLADPTDPGTADTLIIPDKPDIITVEDPPVLYVPEMPEFPGGDAERVRFMKENLSYPEDAKTIGVTGTVYVGFVVEKDGSITQVTVLRGIGSGCDEEAVRVVQMMPKWKPGRQQGHEVRVQFTLPIKFVLH